MPKIANPFSSVSGGANPGTPSVIIQKALPFVYGASALLLLIYLAMGGLQLMTSKGDPKAIGAAQAKITNALIGFVIVILSGIIVLLLGNLLKIGIFSKVIQ